MPWGQAPTSADRIDHTALFGDRRGDGHQQDDDKKQVLAAGSQLNYSPNRMARRLKTNKSYEVCVLTWSTDELHMKKIAALEKSLRLQGYQVNLMIDSPDISDEKKRNKELEKEVNRAIAAEEALRESEELLSVTLSNIEDPVFITDDDGCFTFIWLGYGCIYI